MAGPPGGSLLTPAPDMHQYQHAASTHHARRPHGALSSPGWRALVARMARARRPDGARVARMGVVAPYPRLSGVGAHIPISPAPLTPLVTQPTLPPHQHRRPEAPNHLHAVVRERTTRPFGPKSPIVIDNHSVSRIYYITWLKFHYVVGVDLRAAVSRPPGKLDHR